MLDPTKFHELEAIEAHLQWLTKRFPDQVSKKMRPFLIRIIELNVTQVGLATLGKTHEGRSIYAVTVVGKKNSRKKSCLSLLLPNMGKRGEFCCPSIIF